MIAPNEQPNFCSNPFRYHRPEAGLFSMKAFVARKRVTISTALSTYSSVLIAGGVGTEKKDPVRSTKMIMKKRIEVMIARVEASLTLTILKRRMADAMSSARPVKMEKIAM